MGRYRYDARYRCRCRRCCRYRYRYRFPRRDLDSERYHLRVNPCACGNRTLLKGPTG